MGTVRLIFKKLMLSFVSEILLELTDEEGGIEKERKEMKGEKGEGKDEGK